MVTYLSEKLGGLTFTPKSQSPYRAGTLVHALTDDVSEFTANGFLEANGSAISRTDYADAFAIMGTKYGIGDGSTTFNLPNGPRRTVEVELGNLSGWAGTTSFHKGKCWQDTAGVWWVHLIWYGTRTPDVGPFTVDYGVRGLTWSQNNIGSGAQSNPAGGYVATTASNDLIMGQSSSSSNWSYTVTFPLSTKPGDGFVDNDSRFSTFDEALESIPMVKMYNDASNISMSIKDATETANGTVRLSSAFASGDGIYGLVKKDRSQTKNLPSNITTPSTTIIDFSGLTIGQRYILTGSVHISGTASKFDLKDGTSNLRRWSHQQSNSTSHGVIYYFTAATTTLELETNSAFSGTVAATDGGVVSTWLTLTELNNNITTTDFT